MCPREMARVKRCWAAVLYLVFKSRLQIDAAANLSKLQKEGLLSAVFRF